MNGDLAIRELTPAGRGAVSVLAVEGRTAAAHLAELTGGRLPGPGELCLVQLRAAGAALDEALLLAHSATSFELHLHGSPPLVRRLLAAAPAARAPASDFEARARSTLGEARCEAAARMLLDQAEGALRRELLELAPAGPARRRAALAELAERGRVARWLVEPARVVIAGPVNAGKSTLFNLLLGEGRALTSAEAGTTRDVLREPALFGAYPVLLHDTAGEREQAQSEVEREGQRRARRFQAEADLVLWLGDGVAHPPAWVAPGCAFRAHAQPAELAEPDRLAALEAPEPTRARVLGAFLRELQLPAEPWRGGQGVPFDPALRTALAGLEPRLACEAWRAAVEALLGPAHGS